MITTFFDTYPNNRYSNSLDSIINDTLRFVDSCSSEVKQSSYKLQEQENNIIFKCLMPGLSQENIDINIKNRLLEVKTNDDVSSVEFASPFNKKISLYKDIDVQNSFASLDKGILTITMPIKGGQEEAKIKFR